jgi:hypothetical protein
MVTALSEVRTFLDHSLSRAGLKTILQMPYNFHERRVGERKKDAEDERNFAGGVRLANCVAWCLEEVINEYLPASLVPGPESPDVAASNSRSVAPRLFPPSSYDNAKGSAPLPGWAFSSSLRSPLTGAYYEAMAVPSSPEIDTATLWCMKQAQSLALPIPATLPISP